METKFEIWSYLDRAKYLIEEMGDDKVKITKSISEGEGDENTAVKLEITVSTNSDLLNVFHSGIHYGLEKMGKHLFNK